MFDEMTDEIFAKAGASKLGNETLWEQARDILSGAMARSSITMGLSYSRVEFFNEQKQALVDDLIKMGLGKSNA